MKIYVTPARVELQTGLDWTGYWSVSDTSLSQASSQLLVVCADNYTEFHGHQNLDISVSNGLASAGRGKKPFSSFNLE